MRRVSFLRALHRDERGVSATIVIVLITFVLIPLVALAVDGGVLWRQHIGVGNANDAAALAAAQTYASGDALHQCGTALGDSAAQGAANTAAQQNVGNAAPDTRGGATSPAFSALCTTPVSGQVTVRYDSSTTTFFSLFNGGNSKIVTGKAIAKWGVAVGGGVAPFAIDLSACPLLLVNPPAINTTCSFLFDNNAASARWAGMNLATWGTLTSDSQTCNHSVTPPQYSSWFATPPVESLTPPPVLVCADTGFGGNAFAKAVWGTFRTYIGTILLFPVVAKNGTSIYWGSNPNYKLHIVELIGMKLIDVQTGKVTCGTSVAKNASAACLVLQFTGVQVNGINPGPGTCPNPSLCLRAIKLVG